MAFESQKKIAEGICSPLTAWQMERKDLRLTFKDPVNQTKRVKEVEREWLVAVS